MTRSAAVVALACVVALAPPACAQVRIEDFLKGWPQQRPGSGAVGDVRIGEGLKEALRIGTQNAVALTGRLDGYFGQRQR